MRVFSTITLVLLPISVVSTIFSTNIVDFQSGAGGLAGNWSGPATLWWAVTTLLATVIVGWAGERWRQRAVEAAMAENTGLSKTLKNNTATSHNESWTTEVRDFIHDVRMLTLLYLYAVRPRFMGWMESVAGVLRRPPEATPPSPADHPQHPAASRSHHSVPVGNDVSSVASFRRGKSSSSLPSAPPARSNPPPARPDGRGEGSIVDSTEPGPLHEPVPSGHSPSEHRPPTEESGGAVTLESEKLHSKGFDEASTVEQGLVGVTVTTKEEVLDGTGVQKR